MAPDTYNIIFHLLSLRLSLSPLSWPVPRVSVTGFKSDSWLVSEEVSRVEESR